MTAAVIRRAGRPRSVAVDTAIVEAAVEEMADNGYLGFSIEQVAARAGVAKTTVYRRWPSKDELIFEALGWLKGPVSQAPGGSVRDDLVYLMNRMREMWLNSVHGRVMRRLAADGSERPELYRHFRDRLIAPRQALVRQVLQRGVDEGLIRRDVDLGWVLDTLVAPVIVAAMTHKDRVTRKQVEFTVDTVLRGIAPLAR
jgi:AcrR family transcriptional regulator